MGTMTNKNFYSFSFGCRVNEAEKVDIDRKMKLLGYRFQADNPNIYIINTCSVTHKAEREARQLIYQVKKNSPETKIVVTGCAATYWIKNKLYSDMPVDLMVDNINKEYLVEIIKKRFMTEAKPRLAQPQIFSNKFIGSGRVMVKIQDGCQRFCSFCIVPYLRGMPRSVRIDDIVAKVNSLTHEARVSEVVLTAINTQAYGYDTKERFVDLVDRVLASTGVPRVSFGSLHPWSMDQGFFDFYRRVLPYERLVNFFHIPLQSGSDKMLMLMKRGYGRGEMMEKLRQLETINPMALIATDVIVGFMEESEADFTDTFEFLRDSPISKFHVFRFSKRSKTAADYMSRRLKEPSSAEKLKRSRALIKLGKEKYDKFQAKQTKRVSSALVLEKIEAGLNIALLDNQLPIYIPLRGKAVPGDIIRTKILEFKKGRLFGRIV